MWSSFSVIFAPRVMYKLIDLGYAKELGVRHLHTFIHKLTFYIYVFSSSKLGLD